jgi:hypothetical protein
MPRFVLLRHECPPELGKPSHWDFMLEAGGVLATWSLVELPAAWRDAPGDARRAVGPDDVPATRLGDHRRAYLEYEGPVSDGRGHVRRVDAGTYRVVVERPDHLELELSGAICRGRAVLAADALGAWRLTTQN